MTARCQMARSPNTSVHTHTHKQNPFILPFSKSMQHKCENVTWFSHKSKSVFGFQTLADLMLSNIELFLIRII